MADVGQFTRSSFCAAHQFINSLHLWAYKHLEKEVHSYAQYSMWWVFFYIGRLCWPTIHEISIALGWTAILSLRLGTFTAQIERRHWLAFAAVIILPINKCHSTSCPPCPFSKNMAVMHLGRKYSNAKLTTFSSRSLCVTLFSVSIQAQKADLSSLCSTPPLQQHPPVNLPHHYAWIVQRLTIPGG